MSRGRNTVGLPGVMTKAPAKYALGVKVASGGTRYSARICTNGQVLWLTRPSKRFAERRGDIPRPRKKKI